MDVRNIVLRIGDMNGVMWFPRRSVWEQLMRQTRMAPWVVLALTTTLGAAAAQTPHHGAGAENPRERYVVSAVRVDQPPRIDGVLDDQVWQKASVIDDFTQQEPQEGAPASERT